MAVKSNTARSLALLATYAMLLLCAWALLFHPVLRAHGLATPTAELTPQSYLPALLAPATITPTATQTATRTATPTVTPTPTASRPAPNAPWLQQVNHLRGLSRLPAVSEQLDWSAGCALHARYMVQNDSDSAQQDPLNPWYTEAGQAAGQAANLLVSDHPATALGTAIDQWLSSPFHAVALLDPTLQQAGLGVSRDATGRWQAGFCLDVLRGRSALAPTIPYPVRWPAPGTTLEQLAYDGRGLPDPLSACPGYGLPSGPTILLLFNPGSATPAVTAHSLSHEGTEIEHCLFDENRYSHAEPTLTAAGRAILAARSAVVLLPRRPLAPASRYTVAVTANGQIYTWIFTTGEPLSRVDSFGSHTAGSVP